MAVRFGCRIDGFQTASVLQREFTANAVNTRKGATRIGMKLAGWRKRPLPPSCGQAIWPSAARSTGAAGQLQTGAA